MEFRKYDSIGKDSEKLKFTMASGSVIIENNKALLVKHGDDEFWKFPGGTQDSSSSFIDNAKREAKEELNLDIEIIDENPCVLVFERDKEYVILLHYLSKKLSEPKKGEDVREFDWFDINNLPNDCAPNIKPVVNYFKEKL